MSPTLKNQIRRIARAQALYDPPLFHDRNLLETMFAVDSPLDTGRYYIANVKYQNFFRLPGPNISAEIISGANKNDPGAKVL